MSGGRRKHAEAVDALLSYVHAVTEMRALCARADLLGVSLSPEDIETILQRHVAVTKVTTR